MPTKSSSSTTAAAVTTALFTLILISNGPDFTIGKPTLNPSRRILHQPFFPTEANPPSSSPPPSPPPAPKYPFSSSTPDQSPFFPSYPSPPPPPTTTPNTAFASFPANISSLILPHSPSSKPVSKKLVAVTAALSGSAAVTAAVALFFYLRGRQRRLAGEKESSRSENSAANNGPPPPRKQRAAANTSSEFLYLGTLVNSRSIDGGGAADSSGNAGVRTLPERKLDSPELHPLPPLIGRQGGGSQVRQSRFHAEAAAAETAGAPPQAVAEEDEEEFYSPRGSASGSGSRRVFAAIEADKFINNGGSTEDSSSSSRSSSTSGSPARSASLSISPPVSTSPKSSKAKSPEFVEMQQPAIAQPSPPSSPPLSCLSPQYPSSPERGVMETIKEEESPLLSNTSSSSDMSSPPESPKLTTMSLQKAKESPAKETEWRFSPSRRFSPSSLKLPAFLGGKRRDSPESTIPSPISSTASSASQSPKNSVKSDGYSRKSRSYLASPLSNRSSSSSGRSMHSNPPSPSPRSSNSSDENSSSPARTSNLIPQPASAPPPPPPPPPPPQALRRSESPPPPPPPPMIPVAVENPPVAVAATIGESVESNEETPRPKLKPLHWDKVRASSDREMVWDQLRSSSFKLNEEMIETLFIVNTPNTNPNEMAKKPVQFTPKQENRVLDPKKAQNIAISLRALNVTIEEVCEALLEGNTDTLGPELLESLQKMAPTKEEEWKLKEYKDDSPVKLGQAEKFLKAVINIPFAFKRVEAMLYVANFESEVEYLQKSFGTLEAACDELRNSRMFLKLLEAVLKTGNRMNVGTNRGDARAFKLDTLLKLVDVKGADGKTTLLHFVVQEIIRAEGARHSNTDTQTPNDDAKYRKLGLQVVSSLTSELSNVKKAAAMDSSILSSEVAKLSKGLEEISEVIRLNEQTHFEENTRKFSESMTRFIKKAEEEIIRVQAQESVALSLVKEITEYFHGNSAKEEAHPFRIFMVVRDFLGFLDRVCKEVGMINERTVTNKFPVPVNPMLPIPVNPTLSQGFLSKRQSIPSDDWSP